MERPSNIEEYPRYGDTVIPDPWYDEECLEFDRLRIRAETGRIVLRADEIPWFQNRQGSRVKYFLTAQKPDSALWTMEVFIREDTHHSGMHRHQGGLVIFVLEGKGHTIVDDVRYDWEAGDLVLLPIKPGGVTHQHFNDRPGQPYRWAAFIVNAFREHLANEMVQIVDAPGWTPDQVAPLKPRDDSHPKRPLKAPAVTKSGYNDATVLDTLFALRDVFRRRAEQGIVVVRGKEQRWEINRHGIMKWLLHPFQDETVIKSHLVYVQKIPPGSRSGKQRCPGGTVQIIIDGQGYSVIDSVREDWKAGDCIALPIRGRPVEFQHFNDDQDKPVLLVSVTPNLVEVLGPDMGSELEQLEDAPEYNHA